MVVRSISGIAIAASFVALTVATPIAPTPAEAQIFFSLFGGPRSSAPVPYRDDRGNPFSDFFGSLVGRPGPGHDDGEKKKDSYAQYCVRTCDGKFFPISRGGRRELSLDKICHAMCPSAPTKVFSGLGIDNAASADGQRYSSIPNAFTYRTKIVDNCTCNGRDPFGVAKVDLENDPTLVSGDLVVQKTGVAVYRGARNYTPIERSGMSAAFVKQLQDIKVLPDNPHATYAKTMPVMQDAPETPEQPMTSEVLQEPDSNPNAPAAKRPPSRTN